MSATVRMQGDLRRSLQDQVDEKQPMSLDSDLAFFHIGGTNTIHRFSNHLTTLICLCFWQTQAEDDQKNRWTCSKPVQRSPAVWSCTNETASEDGSEQLEHISYDSLNEYDTRRTYPTE